MNNPQARFPYKLAQKFDIDSGSFFGGMAVDSKMGPRASFYFSQAMDFRKHPSQMTVLPAPVVVNNTTFTDLPIGMETGPDGSRYIVGNNGGFYKQSTADVVSSIATMSSAAGGGIVYNLNNDCIYVSGQKTVSRYGLVQSSPTFSSDLFAQSISTDAGVTNLFNSTAATYTGVLRSTAAASYSVPTIIIETSVNEASFAPDIEPFYSIQVYIVTKGTGDWTLTLHDPTNAVLATVTKANATLTSGALNEFVFTNPVRAQIKPSAITYHFHLTSTVNDGVARVVTASDLSTGYFTLYAYRLVAQNNGLHPMAIFTTFLCIGNGNYLSIYDFTFDSAPTNDAWIRNRLVFPPGYECTGLSVNDQYLVIALERRTTDSSHNYQDGYLFFWDGVAGSPNFYINIPMGSPYAPFTLNNITYFYVNGALHAWAGGKTIMKVRTIPGTDMEYTSLSDTTFVYPNMMASRNNVLMAAYPSTTTNTTVNMGVYSWGAIEMSYPNSFGFSYVTSPGITNYSAANGYKLGMIKSYGDTMYISWQTTISGVTTYGLDKVTNSSPPASVFKWESLVYDGGAAYKQKLALRIKLTFDAVLPSGITVTPKYKIDGGAWTLLSPATAGALTSVNDIDNGRFYTLQWGFDGATSGATSTPIITDIVMEVDSLGMEVNVI